MKRKELASGKELEILFTEQAYDLFNVGLADNVNIRLVHHYKIYGEDIGPVFLARLNEEKYSDSLKYHTEEWYLIRA